MVARLRTARVCRTSGKGDLNRWQSAGVAIIVLIEDDSGIRTALSRVLVEKGHAVRSSSSGMAGLADVVDDPPDVVVLDLGLPDVDGTEVLRMLRAVSAVPIIVATARDDDAEIVRTLDAGADDYVVKPFSGEQLDARIRALLRRGVDRDGGGPATVAVGGLVIDPATREATLDGRALDLSRKEFDLLHHLAANAGRVVTKRELLAEVWQQAYGGADKTVDVHLSWLRRKLGETAADPRYFRTVRGVGVRLVAPEP
jgi:two-component system KDP operon response regulator KdpE